VAVFTAALDLAEPKTTSLFGLDRTLLT